MTSHYEPIGKERFSVEQTDAGEIIRIKPRRNLFLVLFLAFWYIAWTAGGIAVMVTLTAQFEWFLVLWLAMWFAAWAIVTLALLWMFAGHETIRIVGSDLEVANVVPGYTRRWLYQGSQIKHLGVAAQFGYMTRFQLQIPFIRQIQFGAVKFSYGPRTKSFAMGLDEAEAQMIVDRLAKRLPVGAVKA